MLELFSKNQCMQCKFMKKELDKHGIEYTTKMVDEDEGHLAEFKEVYNGSSLPMLVKDGEILSVGFVPDIVDTLK